jgi:hypothetical protein
VKAAATTDTNAMLNVIGVDKKVVLLVLLTLLLPHHGQR